MKKLTYIRNFENFNYPDTNGKEVKHINEVTREFIYEKITVENYLAFLESNLNESMMDNVVGLFNRIKEKFLSGLNVFLGEAAKIGFKIVDKMKTLMDFIFSNIKKFKEKNPVVYKIIMVTIITMIVLIAFSASAYAKAKGDPIDPEKVQMLAGFITDAMKGMTPEDKSLAKEAIGYLKDLQDGQLDEMWSQKVIEFSNRSQEHLDFIIEESKKDEKNSSYMRGGQDLFDYCKRLIDNGKYRMGLIK
jgi:hypothetical protein